MEHALTRPHELAAALEQQCDLAVPLERAAGPTRPVGTPLFRREATERAAAGRALDPPARVEGSRQQHLAPGPPHQGVLDASHRNEDRKSGSAAGRGADVVIAALELGGLALRIEVARDVLARSGAEAAPQVVARQQGGELPGDALHIALVCQQATLLLDHCLRNAAVPCRDDWDAIGAS